jgi:hypothetical protein
MTLTRAIAGLIAALTWSVLALRFHVVSTRLPDASVLAVLWNLAAFFTLLTNLLAAMIMSAVALGWVLPARIALSLAVSISIVGIVYHAILAKLWSPQGLELIADLGLHTVVPVVVVVYWLALAPKAGLKANALGAVLIWPLAYMVLALTRGAVTGFWPYGFLNADQLGWAQVGLNLVGLLSSFTVLALLLIGLARIIR